MKYLLLLMGIFTLSVLLVISHALTKDIIDNTTGKKVPDREGKILGIAGYINGNVAILSIMDSTLSKNLTAVFVL